MEKQSDYLQCGAGLYKISEVQDLSYESLAGRYPEIQRLFDRICTLVNDEERMPAELLPDAVRWLKLRIKDPDELREAVGRTAKYLKYLSQDK